MPYYKSKTEKEVVVRLGKNKKEIKVGTKPQFLPYEDIHLLFPKYITKLGKAETATVIKEIKPLTKHKIIDERIKNEIIKQNPQTFQIHFLQETLPTGSWNNQRCFIIGGGPSLKEFDFSKLQGERVIAINKAFVDAPFADIQFSVDRQFQEWVTDPKKGGDKMAKARDAWPHFKGHKVWLKVPGEHYFEGIEFVKSAGNEGISLSLEEGVYDGSNSGYAALNLAIALGANPIYLLGYDMKHNNGNSHYHEGYFKEQKENQLTLFARKFPKLAELAKEKNIQVVNLNQNSELQCFPFDTLENALKPVFKEKKISEKNYIIVSFYTPEYTNDILRLTQSVEKFELPYHFELLKHLPLEGKNKQNNWSKNAYQKANFIKNMMTKFLDKNIIWIDDAVVQEYPYLFDNMPDCDIAVHYRRGKELLTGTMFIRNNELMKNVVEKWIFKNEKSPYFLEQKNLEEVLRETPQVNIHHLPLAYCQIFDGFEGKSRPVIEHFQSSRKWRKKEDIQKKITVLMPTYNQGKFIQESIDSVLSQTFTNFELIIVNDGSTDNTKEILERQTDPRIRIIHKENGGTGSALNLGFENAVGEYETWLASDNKYYPNALQDMFNILEKKKNVDFVYCNCEIGVMDETGLGEVTRKNYNSEISMEWDSYKFYEHHNIGVIWLWRKELRLVSGTHFITDPCEDYEMTIRMIEAGGNFYYHPTVSGWHRRHPENLTKKLLTSGQYVQNLVKAMVNRRNNKLKSGAESIFTNIYQNNKWHGTESRSGHGSTLAATEKIREGIPTLFKKYKIKTIIDAACGDWNWMRHLTSTLDFESYMGIDIVKDIIDKNIENHENEKITFHNMNLINQNLTTKADVIVCRDMLNHLSNFDVIEVLKNFIQSGSTYMLITNFPKERPNKDILTGAWRTINFGKEPFEFPSPIETINEGCDVTDILGTYEDKEMALWKLDDIAEIIFKETSSPKHKQRVINNAVIEAIKLLKQAPEPPQQANLSEWCLKKIPKKIFFYWGAEVLPFLHYLTIKSFIKFNPDWKVIFYRPKELSLEKPWSGWEHKYKLICDDYMDKLLELPLELRYFDARCLGMENHYPEIIKSDFLRWHLLATEGGVWADMDIIFTASMNHLRFNYKKNENVDTVVAICEDFLPEYMFHTIGFMMSSGNNDYYNYIAEKSKKVSNNFTDYEMVGNQLLNKEFPSIKKIQETFPSLVVENVPFESLYVYYPLKRVPELFSEEGIERRTNNSIGIHWYAGHFCVEKPVNGITEFNYKTYSNTPIGKFIQEAME
ncbi:MAG: glycosyltransferase [Patescibacteria group bacterium]